MEPRYSLKAITALLPSFLVLSLLVCTTVNAAASRASGDIILWYRNYDSPAIRNLLKLSLDKTPEYGPYKIVRSREMNQGRALLNLENGVRDAVDVANVASSPRRKGLLNTIPFPIDGGLLGYRVCLINKGDQKKFDGIRRLQDFRDRHLSIGQGTHWPDTKIMRANGLRVVTNTEYESLFAMLRRNRFDCFARGVSEVMFDLENIRPRNLVVEKNLLFVYRLPSFFFVSPSNTALKQRITEGLERAVFDGSFLAHLDRYYKEPIDTLDLSSRVVMVLGNPWMNSDKDKASRGVVSRMWQRVQLGETLTDSENVE